MTNSKIISLHTSDNVAVTLSHLSMGDTFFYKGSNISVKTNIEFGHKVATKFIKKGELVLKYGAPIGIANKNITPGEHVHIHNIESLYMKQFTK